MIRVEPARVMVYPRKVMNRLFDDSCIHPFGFSTCLHIHLSNFYPIVDVIFHANLPGFKTEDIQISITGDELILKGEVEEKKSKWE